MFSTVVSIAAKKGMPKRTLGALAVAFALTGCVSANAGSDGRYATPIGNAPVINNETPYSNALRCLAGHVPTGANTTRIAVGNIRDYTGKSEADGTGMKVTQGASLMAMSALGKAGVPLVERYDTSISELEMKYTNNKLIGDAVDGEYRKIYAGEIRGSDYYVVGGITELNFNIQSGGLNAGFAEGGDMGAAANASASSYVMNIGLDLRLVNSRTLEVVDYVSYQKQIVGREIKAGVFDFFGGNLFSLGVGSSAQEPIQLAVRAVVERAVLKLLVPLYGVNPADCARFPGNKDPMGEIDYRQANPGAKAKPAHNQRVAQASAPSRSRPVENEPYAYYSEPVFESGSLRGGSY
ncbi:holdfast anchoring protein HfaB [Parvibaculum sp.]|uniref:holdfast anchoring protein HfaB n=1 Tax=Parvibaculum sp. TaxID=2024848 RepID=UPI001B018A25|nr:holdfast anchoring protein HfaB [Parvibaculum sp.]MBO6679991.1 holdfast anchoring protein HfaB [Parvibaculum sp.]MBO6683552.1 holdfast anchoring protein HfaB [Parvibaculum sp.]MBO6904680.1 holdfast anchoring protein HfaB [Parvibaculum sp.]